MDAGMFVLAIMLIVLAGGVVLLVLPARHSADGHLEHETLNRNAQSPQATRSVMATASHPVSEPTFDTLTPDGSCSAIAGAGAGGYTPDARRPLIGGGGDPARS